MQKKTRMVSLDVLRIVCCIFVIAIHTVMTYRTTSKGISYDLLLTESFMRCCVPVFFMLTGFFMFQRKRTVAQVARYLGKRIVAPMLLHFAIMSVFSGWLLGWASLRTCIRSVSWQNVTDYLLMLLTWKMPAPNFWLWYITDLVKIYFFYPVLQYICTEEKEARRIRRLYMALCFLSTMVIPTIVQLFRRGGSIFIYSPLPFYAFFYVLLGYEFSQWYAKKPRWLNWKVGAGVYLAGSLLTYALTVYVDIAPDQLFDHLFFHYELLNVAISAVGLFILALSIDLRENALVEYIASTSFFIYLTHAVIIFKLDSLHYYEWVIQRLGIYWGCMVSILVVFCIALLLATGVRVAKGLVKALWRAGKQRRAG